MLLAIEWKNQRKIWMNQTGKNNCRCQEKVLVVNQIRIVLNDLKTLRNNYMKSPARLIVIIRTIENR